MTAPELSRESPLRDLSETAQQQELIDVFGEHLQLARASVLSSISSRLESPTARAELATAFRKHFEALSSLPEDQREAIKRLVATGVDGFAKEVLRLLGNEGVDLRIGNGEAVRYQLDASLLEADSGRVVASHPVSRGGRRFLPEMWSEWVRRFHRA